MKIGKVIYGLLDADATYKSAIGSDSDGNIKVYPSGDVPQGLSRPYAVYQVVGGSEEHDKDAHGISSPRFQLDQFASSHDQACDLDDKAKDALDRYTGTINGVKVQSIRAMTAMDDFGKQSDSKRVFRDYITRIRN